LVIALGVPTVRLELVPPVGGTVVVVVVIAVPYPVF
jgi:hypothetical protein